MQYTRHFSQNEMYTILDKYGDKYRAKMEKFLKRYLYGWFTPDCLISCEIYAIDETLGDEYGVYGSL